MVRVACETVVISRLLVSKFVETFAKFPLLFDACYNEKEWREIGGEGRGGRIIRKESRGNARESEKREIEKENKQPSHNIHT